MYTLAIAIFLKCDIASTCIPDLARNYDSSTSIPKAHLAFLTNVNHFFKVYYHFFACCMYIKFLTPFFSQITHTVNSTGKL